MSVPPARGTAPALVLDAVARCFGGHVALAPLSLRQEAGTVCLVTGPNGSGKTTLLRLAAGLLAPSAGRRAGAFPAVYLRPGDGARRHQRVRSAVEMVAALRGGHVGGSPASVATSAAAALATCGLAPLAERLVGTLSAGQRARVTLAVALAARPALLCLDEPTAHLDPEGVAAAEAVVARLVSLGTAVLVATHDEFLADAADARLHIVGGRAALGDGPGRTLEAAVAG